MALEVIAILAATGALAGFVTAQFLPRQYRSGTTVEFNEAVSADRLSYAAEQTLSNAALGQIVVRSAYYITELDYTPVPELVERIRRNSSIKPAKIGGRDRFRVEFTDPDRYAALDTARMLADEMTRNTGRPSHVAQSILTSLTGPGPGSCAILGTAAGMAIGLIIVAIANASYRQA